MFKHILVAVDGSKTAAQAFDAALRLARENDAELHPLYVVDVPVIGYDVYGYDPSIVRDAYFEEGKRVTTDALAQMKRDGVRGTPRIVEVEPIGSDIAQCMRQVAIEQKIDLVVMGTHGRRGFRRFVLGSVAERFLRISPCPVLLFSSADAAHEPAVADAGSGADAKQRPGEAA
jgi:nucleotide-binding universal stress UspA family protein